MTSEERLQEIARLVNGVAVAMESATYNATPSQIGYWTEVIRRVEALASQSSGDKGSE